MGMFDVWRLAEMCPKLSGSMSILYEHVWSRMYVYVPDSSD